MNGIEQKAFNYIPIEKEMIPYSFDIRVAGETFTFTINYNLDNDFFTVDLMRDTEVLAYGEVLTYGRALFSSYADERFPRMPIIPYDLSMQEERVGWENFMEKVFLFIIEEAG